MNFIITKLLQLVCDFLELKKKSKQMIQLNAKVKMGLVCVSAAVWNASNSFETVRSHIYLGHRLQDWNNLALKFLFKLQTCAINMQRWIIRFIICVCVLKVNSNASFRSTSDNNQTAYGASETDIYSLSCIPYCLIRCALVWLSANGI